MCYTRLCLNIGLLELRILVTSAPLGGITIRHVCLCVCLLACVFIHEYVLGPNISKTVEDKRLGYNEIAYGESIAHMIDDVIRHQLRAGSVACAWQRLRL